MLHLKDSSNPNANGRQIMINEYNANCAVLGGGMDIHEMVFARNGGARTCFSRAFRRSPAAAVSYPPLCGQYWFGQFLQL